MERKSSPATKQGQSNTQNNSTAAQRRKLEAELREHPVSTIYAREKLDIMAPAARVLELRYDYGLNIQTHWNTIETINGNKHRVAEYVLLPGRWEGKAA